MILFELGKHDIYQDSNMCFLCQAYKVQLIIQDKELFALDRKGIELLSWLKGVEKVTMGKLKCWEIFCFCKPCFILSMMLR